MTAIHDGRLAEKVRVRMRVEKDVCCWICGNDQHIVVIPRVSNNIDALYQSTFVDIQVEERNNMEVFIVSSILQSDQGPS